MSCPSPRSLQDLLRGRNREKPPIPHQREAIAVRGLVHHMSSRPAASSPLRGKRFERLPEVVANGISPTVGSSRTRTSGSPSRAVARDTRALCPPDMSRTMRFSNSRVGPWRSRHRCSPAGRRGSSEEPQVLPWRQIGVDRRRLGHVRHPRAQARRAGRLAQPHPHPLDDLHTDDGPHQRGLAATAGPEQPGDRPGVDPHGEAGQDEILTAANPEVKRSLSRASGPPPLESSEPITATPDRPGTGADQMP